MLAKRPEDRYASADDVVSELDAWQSGAALASTKRSGRLRRGVVTAVAVMAVVAIAAAVWKTRPHREQPEIVTSPSAAIAVLPLRNLSGNPSLQWMEDAIPEMLNAALSRSGELRVLDRLRLVEILQELGRETTGRIEEADAMAMARRARVGTLITGEIVGSGSTIRVQCKVVDASTGRLLHSEIVEGAGDDDVFKMVAQLTDALQTYLHIQAVGETVDESWVRDVTSRSLDAFRHYVRGRSLLMSSQWVEARGELEAAIAADSNFVMAYVDLTGACFNLEDYPCIGAAYAHALRLRPRAAPREQLTIDLIGAIVNDQNEQQVRIASELLQTDPEGAFWRYALGRGYYFSGRYREAVDAWQPLLERRWKWVWTNIYMSDALCRLKRYDEALAALEPGWELVDESRTDLRATLFRFRGRIHSDRGDYELASADFDAAERLRPGYEMVKYDRGLLAQRQGRSGDAARLFRDFLATGIKAPEVEDATQRLATLQ
jgi:TolB-like protein